MREPSFGRRARGFGRRLLWTTIGLALVVLVAFLFWTGVRAPTARLATPLDVVGRASPASIEIEAGRTGLRSWQVLLRGPKGTTVVAEEDVPKRNPLGSGVRTRSVDVVLDARGAGLDEGAAQLVVLARDHSPLAALRGPSVALEVPLTVDLTPPAVTVLGGQHYLARGGSGAVAYTVGPDAVRSGVSVGPYLFPGVAGVLPDPATRAALYAFPYEIEATVRPKVVAEDAAGNRREVPFPVTVRDKSFPSEELAISDDFLAVKVPEILAENELQPAADPVASYLLVNRDLRRTSEERIREITSQSEPRLLIDGAFRQQPGSKVGSRFAEHRTYRYGEEVIDTQVHLGYDLASVKQAPVFAGNAGKVAFVGSLGIYGTSVMIDHGLGLFSLYAHLSSVEVENGQMLAKGTTIGRTGETGLAGGDHLHFSILLSGTHVDPVEWWDPRWLENRVLAQVAPEPSPTPAPAASPGPDASAPGQTAG